MRPRIIKSCFILLGAILFGGERADGLAQNSNEPAIPFDAAKLRDQSLWTRVNKEPYYIASKFDLQCRLPTREDYEAERKRNPHASTFITVYVNPVGKESMLSVKSVPFPQGSVIIKEKRERGPEPGAPLLYTLMIKREPGYNPPAGDWEFAVASGENGRIQARGKIENCTTCHLEKSGQDYVFRPYVETK
jgi:hypothetical protein